MPPIVTCGSKSFVTNITFDCSAWGHGCWRYLTVRRVKHLRYWTLRSDWWDLRKKSLMLRCVSSHLYVASSWTPWTGRAYPTSCSSSPHTHTHTHAHTHARTHTHAHTCSLCVNQVRDTGSALCCSVLFNRPDWQCELVPGETRNWRPLIIISLKIGYQWAMSNDRII